MNFEPYRHLIDGNNLEPMDERHVRMIHAVLVGECPDAVVNIGCANGFSCAASVVAADSFHISRVYCIDTKIRDSLKAIVGCRDNFEFIESDSKSSIVGAECWVIDGDHKEGAVTDYENARRMNARIIIAHDTHPEWAPACQWGAIEIGKRMRESCVAYFEDWADRKDEMTKRGLTIAFYYQPKQETMDRLQAIARSE